MKTIYQNALLMVIQRDRHGFASILRYLWKIGDIDGARVVRAIGSRLREVHH